MREPDLESQEQPAKRGTAWHRERGWLLCRSAVMIISFGISDNDLV